MKLAVAATKEQKEGLSGNALPAGHEIIWLDKLTVIKEADCYLDLLYNDNSVLPETKAPVIVNSVTATCNELPGNVIRINAWPTFLEKPLLEAATLNEEGKNIAENVLQLLGKTLQWVPDQPGFVTARVISMIINEAYLALEEGVSSKEAIDTAMKLGTNYPYGPFEWAEKIGKKTICSLLNTLAVKKDSYRPALLLENEAAEE